MKLYGKFKRSASSLLLLFAFISITGICSGSAGPAIKNDKAVLQDWSTGSSEEQKEAQPPENTQDLQASDGQETQAENSSSGEEQLQALSAVEPGTGETGSENSESAALQEDAGSRQQLSAEKSEVISRGADMERKEEFLLPWFGTVENIFKTGTIATVTDVDTGISFQVKRTYGTNHADVETLTAQDTAALKKLAGGSWSWARRAIAVDIKGEKLAASMNLMPHAGIDSEPANVQLEQRSGGYGPGVNLDSVKGNEMDGVFCIHFYESKTHDSDKMDEQHQEMVMKANQWLLKNQ